MSQVVPQEPKNLFQKLAEVVTAIKHVEKRGTNTFQKYSYVKAADIANAVRGELSERNIYMISDVVEARNYTIPAKEGVMQAVDVRVAFTFVDGDSQNSRVSFSAWGTGTDKGDKAVYKAMTGALKYGLRNAFLIPDELDPEGDVEESTTVRPQATPIVEPPAMNKAPAREGVDTRNEPHISVAPAAIAAMLGKPTKEQLGAYKVRTTKIRTLLEDAGFQSSTGMSTGAKLGKYFARVAGVESPLDMSVAQWDTTFAVLDLLMKEPKQAVERIEETIK